MEKVKSIHHTFSACTRPTWEFVKAAAPYDFRWRSTFLEKIAAPTRQTCPQTLFAETRSGGWPRTVKNCSLLVQRGRNSREQWDLKEEKRKGGKPPNLEANAFPVSNIHRNSIAQASPADREGKDQGGKKAAGGLREYVEIRVEPSSLLKDRAGGDLCRVGTVYL